MSEQIRLKHRYVHALFCEDARAEISNQATLVGAYTAAGAVTLPLPVVLPKLVIIIWFAVPVGDRVHNASVVVRVPGAMDQVYQLDAAEFNDPRSLQPGATRVTASIVVQLQGVRIERAGRVEAIVRADGEEYLAGVLKFENETDKTVAVNELPQPLRSESFPLRRRRVKKA